MASPSKEQSLQGPRARYREQVIDDIVAAALDQVEAGGLASLSLNAVARQIGMTPPALYRYFAGRDDLVTELLVRTYAELAAALEQAAAEANGADRLRAVARAYRGWARDHPGRYQLLFGAALPDYEAPSERTRPPARRGLAVVIDALGELRSDVPAEPATIAARVWSRLHGFVSLEIGNHLDGIEADRDRLFDAEVEDLLELAASDPT